jgi:Porin subfamily
MWVEQITPDAALARRKANSPTCRQEGPGRMTIRLTSLAFLAALAVTPTKTASAQSLDELKAMVLQQQQMVLKLQKQVEQLQAAQQRAPTAERRAPPVIAQAPAAPRPSSNSTQAAQLAADTARQSAAEAKQAAAQAQQEATRAKDTAASEFKAQFAAPPGKPPGSFRVPGTEIVVRIYGFVKFNGITDLTTQDQNDSLSAQSIQLFGTAAQRQGGDTQFSARRSRFDLETWAPVNDMFGEFHTLMEIDFAGQNTSLTTQATANGYTPRLRKFYADFGRANGGWGAFLFGQENSVFSDNSLLPIQLLNDATFVGVSNIRQAQVRYTYGFGDGVSAAFGVESPYSDITTATGVSFPDSNGGGGVGWQAAPDFTGRLLWKQKWGLLALRGLLRSQIDLNNEGAAGAGSRFNKSTTGYGVGVTGVVNLFDDRLVLMASANVGSGIGRYLDSTSNGYGAVSNTGLSGVFAQTTSLDAVTVYGAMIGLQYFLTPTIRTNMAIGGARLMLPGYTSQFGGCVGASIPTGTCSSNNTTEASGTINLIWSPFKALDLGLEYQHLERNLQAPFSTGTNTATTGGIANRLEFSAIGRF